MFTGAGRTIAWDVENRPVSITTGNSTATFVYDGDGNRALKTEGGQTTLYINKYYEKSLTSGNATAYYFLGGRLIGMKEGAANVTYVHQDHLTGTSVVSDSAGGLVSSIAYAPFGSTRAGAVSTDIQFTGQRLDSTGLYYYNARYYDPAMGRFISPDTFMLSPSNPQGLNRYSYAFNNPLKYNDPSGNWPPALDKFVSQAKDVAGKGVNAVKRGLQVAESKVVEIEQGVGTKIAEIYESAKQIPEKVKQASLNAVGVESITQLNASLASNAPVIDVREGSMLDDVIFFTDTAVTLYPIGVFSNSPIIDPIIQEEEGYHWNDQKNAESLFDWYTGYIIEYGFYMGLYGGNDSYAHNAVSAERDAMSYAANQVGIDYTPPPTIFEYWWNEFFGP